MKVIIQHVFMGLLSIAFCQESTWGTSSTSMVWNSFSHRMTFREPIVFTPFEIKAGYLNYGGKDYWSGSIFNKTPITTSDLPVFLDSTQYQFNILDALSNRRGTFIEVDFLRTNLPHFFIHQNYFDLQFGLGFQYTDFLSNPSLPSETGKEWIKTATRGDYHFHPRSLGLNTNTSLSWQLSRNRATYIYYSFGVNSISLYESDGGDKDLTGMGLSESFGIGTKYIFNQSRGDFNYTIGVEAKWSRLYMTSVNAAEDLSPINGVDLRASGIFLTTGIQFGGKHTDGDIAYSYMINNDFISAAEGFENFLAKERRHGKRDKALEMLQYCQSQIPYQQVNYGVEAFIKSEFTDALEWFNAAEKEAKDDLKIEIQQHRRNIAAELLDSVKNYKNQMSIAEAEKLILMAQNIYPELTQVNETLAGLYLDKGKLNTEIGNYSAAIQNYLDAIQLYPTIESLVIPKLKQITNSIMKDAFFAMNDDELYLVINYLESIIELNPEMENELDSYIVKLELQLENQRSKSENQYAQDYIIQRKKETMPEILQLGMTYEEVKQIKGLPKHIGTMNEPRRQFEMWTYPTDSITSRLYFENNMLVRIEE